MEQLNEPPAPAGELRKILIEPMSPDHWENVRLIYGEGIATGNATFETEVPAWEAWNASKLPACRYIARDGAKIIGWGALGPVSGRSVYSGVAEVSVYVSGESRGRGVGGVLLDHLIAESEREGIWTLQAGIFPENFASIAIHAARGFREVGRRERLGKMGDRWRDVLLLERRSSIVGL